MPSNYVAQRTGRCPYCLADSYDGALSEIRRPGQTLMKCTSCNNWSVRMRAVQYPLQDPADKASSPAMNSQA